MLKRLLLTMALSALAIGTGVTSAYAWGNGGPNPNDYGTHDWILSHAITNAGSEGTWVSRSIALKASDDPDTYKSNSEFHVFRDKTGARGAAEETSRLYYLAVRAYQSGDKAKASKYVGLLSHYYTDVLVPFHSSYDARSYPVMHYKYEITVSRQSNNYSDNPTWAAARAPKPVGDIRQRTVAAAYYSRSKFPTLKSALKSDPTMKNPTVRSTTKALLNRGVNDMADIIRAIPQESGLATSPATMKVWLSQYYPGQNRKIGAYVKCTDANGQPLEGVGVKFAWKFKDYTYSKTVYTLADGTARVVKDIGSAALYYRVPVVATQTSSGKTISASTSFLPTPPLATDGGIVTNISDAWPSQDQTITATTTCKTSSGKPVPYLVVNFLVTYPDGTQTLKATTNASGKASVSFNVGDAEVGARCSVMADTWTGSTHRGAGRIFVPQE